LGSVGRSRVATRRPRARRGFAWWVYRRLTARARPLPDFLVIGAQKCGTTSAYAYLVRHPRVARPWRKEVRFFEAPANYALGETWYRAHFAIRRPETITGEASPGYMFYTDAPSRIARHVPDVRLIALVRNPVDRAFSHYHHLSRRGVERRSFETALDHQLPQLPAAPGADADTYLVRGLYALQLENVLRVFPRAQLLVLASEDLLRSPEAAVARMFEFLGLSTGPPAVSRRLNAGQYATMPDGLRQRLAAFYRPHNERLYDLLGRDFGWDA
jgi:hypothetical protein